jgi:hypothetical protein
VRRAFDCVKFICDSLLPELPVEAFERLVKCCEAIGSQVAYYYKSTNTDAAAGTNAQMLTQAALLFQDTDQKCAQDVMALFVEVSSFLGTNRQSLIDRLTGLPHTLVA